MEDFNEKKMFQIIFAWMQQYFLMYSVLILKINDLQRIFN